jgi:predicted SprT family Zn-dependent metalloprotease
MTNTLHERIRRAMEDWRCDCGGRIEPHGMHERDSSGDYYTCDNCGWRFDEHDYQDAMKSDDA